MKIVCPTCAAAYEVPDARLIPGHAVRCARCGTDWAPLADTLPIPLPLAIPTPPYRPEAVLPSAPLAVTEAAQPMPPAPINNSENDPAMGPLVAAGWVASVAVLAGLGWAAVNWRDDVMRAWPPSERVYRAAGLVAAQ